MNTKFNKIVKTAAVGIFFIALFFNVKVSLENPFIRIDNAVLAQTSSVPSCDSKCLDFFNEVCSYTAKDENGDDIIVTCPNHKRR